MQRREGGEQPSCTIKIDPERSDVLKKRNKGLETSALVILLELFKLPPYTHGNIGFVMWAWKSRGPSEGIPRGLKSPMSKACFRELCTITYFELHRAAWLCF